MSELPRVNRATMMYIPLEIVIADFLNSHGKHVTSYTLPESPHVLRQPHLPDDASILYASLDQDDSVRENALGAMQEFISVALMLLPESVPEGSEDDLTLSRLVALRNDAVRVSQRLTEAIATPPTRDVVVRIASEKFEPAAIGEEPVHPFLPHHFSPRTKVTEK